MVLPIFEDIASAGSFLSGGGILIYPTETFYAIGCLANAKEAIAEICRIKRRQANKPLPVVAENISQANQLVEVDYAPEELLKCYWPGPLTILLPAKPGIAQQLVNEQYFTAIRVTSNPTASGLCAAGGCPLVATSANLADYKPASRLQDLENNFFDACRVANCAIFAGAPELYATNIKPSTVVAIEDRTKCRLRILRAGIIEEEELRQKNYL